jgi:CheY-like chemotaxis protein
VLVVDDAPVNLDLLQGILEPSGFQVQRASGVRAALDLARASRPDLIVTDLMMRPEGGFDLLAHLKSEPALRGIPVIIHSATATGRSIEQQSLALGAARFLARPIEPEVLLREIAGCLRDHQATG